MSYMPSVDTVARPLISAQGLHKSYRVGKVTVEALAGIDLEIRRGEYVSVSGPSGCGKSTLLAMLGALDRPTKGKIRIRNVDLSQLDENGLAEMRAKIGFVFQFFNLMPHLTARENVELGMYAANIPRAARRTRAEKLLNTVGLGERFEHRPSELSGGEQQRVAIARALARDPDLLLLDEPTGNLDSKSARAILDLVLELHRQKATTIVMITHVPAIAKQADRSLLMADGKIVSEQERKPSAVG